MKKVFLVLLLSIVNMVSAQIKIGDNPETLDTTSLLELESASKVIVISRMTEGEMLAIDPLEGAMVYNTDASCIFYYDGAQWNNMCVGENPGSISWGSLTGSLTDQTDLAAEFENYVNLSTSQSIAGEKTLMDKLTVNTGDVDAQIAEFLGRVKGEEGLAPEDFVTKAQLDASGGATNWGAITGDLVNQTDLASEFENYVNLSTAQSVSGEKTLTNKLTVNTGNIDAQIAEFLGRVKGEEGTEPEDFVTKAQLDASGGATNWGAITGDLVGQTDLVSEFENYVDITTSQSVAGEKTLTDKLTINTGDVNAQIAEFLGRVKGEEGTDPEDFVTKAQLDASGGASSWGTITGDLVDQTDLTEEFENYVDITTAQLVAGEKTLTDKLTVNTGDSSIQVAEFQGRVKGEDGTAPEDFVTRLQLDAITSGGHTGTQGSVFFAGDDTQPTEDNENLFYDNTNRQFRVGGFVDDIAVDGLSDDETTLSLQGSFSTPIGFPRNLTEEHHTTIIRWSTYVTLPDPTTCIGRIYIVKTSPKNFNNPTEDTRVQLTNRKGYTDSASVVRFEFPPGSVTQLQSSGYTWEQIN
ncbi:hypothetical protein [Maribacter sp. 1_MG-2023]|uniref:hypothetical protein n=1 Tax=Maribacter sp. 1_MG-2023 TaxID=3062677 RepID=UPI0026E46AC9|nr:hypothetical protein [Maribacter sp. 1_MG-2023]MDO6470708.1 hypothetical protein [Maribacter sp. 1_MG-2023]